MLDDETILSLNAYVDGELSPTEILAMERRLAAEPELRAYVDRLSAMSGRLQTVFAAQPPLPAGTGVRIARAIGIDGVEAGVPSPARRSVGSEPWSRAVALAASLAVGIGIGYGLAGPFSPWPASRDPGVSAMVYAGHLRALAAPQPFDVASSDRHVVKPWFNGRTTIAPTAPDLASEGFPLVGGRIDVVGDDPVPTLVYKRDRHVISVTVVPSMPGLRDGEATREGSTILRWVAGNLTYVAVSDLNAGDFRRFVALFKKAS